MHRIIRRVGMADAAAVIELLNPIIQAGIYTVMDEPLSLDDEIDFIRAFPQQGVFLAAFNGDGGGLLGVQDVVPWSAGSRVFGHVGVVSTFVSLASRRQGVGRELSAATFQAARELGFLKLSAAIRADNPGALAFYQGLGFRIIGAAHRHALLHGRYIDEVLAEKWLGD